MTELVSGGHKKLDPCSTCHGQHHKMGMYISLRPWVVKVSLMLPGDYLWLRLGRGHD